MFVAFICIHQWGTTYYGYGNNGLLYRWSVDSAGSFDFIRCPTSLLENCRNGIHY